MKITTYKEENIKERKKEKPSNFFGFDSFLARLIVTLNEIGLCRIISNLQTSSTCKLYFSLNNFQPPLIPYFFLVP